MSVMRKVLGSMAFKIPLIRHFLEIHYYVKSLAQIPDISIENYITKYMHENPKYQNPKRLNRFEYQVYSQNGEDGIITEIFKRIGTTNRFFVEFGASELMNNTTYLLLKDWTGAWIETSPNIVKRIKAKHSSLIKNKKLLVKNATIAAENVEMLFKELDIPKEFDLMSIDIDGNDYWVWKAIENYYPRAVVIEYNAKFRQEVKWVMKYNPNHRWRGTCYQGASLKSLETLGLKKGYKLIGCDFNGVNSFFVREDLVKDKFLEPYTAESHYEPPRHFLQREIGRPRDLGDFECI